MTRGGRDKERDDPERRCIVTGESQPEGRADPLRDRARGQVVPDLLGQLPGRGIYVAADRAALDKAAAKGHFARAAKQPVTVPADLADRSRRQLARRVVDLISLARKAGEAVAGFEKVKDWLVKGQAAVLIQASDGSERGKAKLQPPGGKEPFIGCLTARELGLAFGREHAIHGALAAGGLSDSCCRGSGKACGARDGHMAAARPPRKDTKRRMSDTDGKKPLGLVAGRGRVR